MLPAHRPSARNGHIDHCFDQRAACNEPRRREAQHCLALGESYAGLPGTDESSFAGADGRTSLDADLAVGVDGGTFAAANSDMRNRPLAHCLGWRGPSGRPSSIDIAVFA